jgi:hypothetical protein
MGDLPRHPITIIYPSMIRRAGERTGVMEVTTTGEDLSLLPRGMIDPTILI